MWKVVTGVAVVALAAFFLLRNNAGEAGEQSGQKTGAVSLSGMPADAQPSSSTASRSMASDDTVQPQFTSYEVKPAKRVTKSTTGTVVVFPDGRRSPPR
jgi:hypothetical protein